MKKLYLLLLVTLLICGCSSTAKETETVSEVAVETEKVVSEVDDTTVTEVAETEVAEVIVENEHGPWDRWSVTSLSTETKKKLYYAGYVVRCQYTEDDGSYTYCILPYSVDRTCSVDEIDDLTEGMKNAFELALEAFEIPLQLESVGQTSIYQMYSDVYLCDLESTGCWGSDADVVFNTNKRRVITKDLELTSVDVDDPDAKFGYFPEFLCRAKE